MPWTLGRWNPPYRDISQSIWDCWGGEGLGARARASRQANRDRSVGEGFPGTLICATDMQAYRSQSSCSSKLPLMADCINILLQL